MPREHDPLCPYRDPSPNGECPSCFHIATVRADERARLRTAVEAAYAHEWELLRSPDVLAVFDGA